MGIETIHARTEKNIRKLRIILDLQTSDSKT